VNQFCEGYYEIDGVTVVTGTCVRKNNVGLGGECMSSSECENGAVCAVPPDSRKKVCVLQNSNGTLRYPRPNTPDDMDLFE
jgi:hypothetical protein